MILVDIEFPAINKRYDFKLDENVYIVDLIDQIASMVIPTEERESEKKVQNMLMYEEDKGRILELNKTLRQCGIGNGTHLVML